MNHRLLSRKNPLPASLSMFSANTKQSRNEQQRRWGRDSTKRTWSFVAPMGSSYAHVLPRMQEEATKNFDRALRKAMESQHLPVS